MLKDGGHSDCLGQNSTELLMRYGHTGLGSALEDLVGEGSDAFAGNGRQREGVLGVCPQTFDKVRGPGLENLLLLLTENSSFIN